MSNVYPYGHLTENPHNEIGVCWIDEDGGDSQTLDYNGDSISVEPESLESFFGSGYHAYRGHVTGLDSNTTYDITIHGSETVSRTISTMPAERSDLRICAWSDSHVDDGHMDDTFQHIGARHPDLLLIPGDLVTGFGVEGDGRDEDMIKFFDEFLDGEIHDGDELIPLAVAPGNHCVKYYDWEDDRDLRYTGTEEEVEDYEQFPFAPVFMNNMFTDDTLHYEVNIGGWLQILVIDTFQELATNVGEWVGSNIDETADIVIPIHHSPFLEGGDRGSTDRELSENLRNAVLSNLSDAGNVRQTIAGHVHVHKRTVPYTVSDEPDGQYLELDDGYVVESTRSSGIIEFGDGFRNNYSPINEWWLSKSGTDDHNWYEINIGNPTYETTTRDEDGDAIHTVDHTTVPDIILGAGNLGDVTF